MSRSHASNAGRATTSADPPCQNRNGVETNSEEPQAERKASSGIAAPIGIVSPQAASIAMRTRGVQVSAGRPARRPRFSNSATRTPRRASRIAQMAPAGPPPMTVTGSIGMPSVAREAHVPLGLDEHLALAFLNYDAQSRHAP